MIEFSIPAVPTPLNVLLRKHWSVRQSEQRKWDAFVAVARAAMPRERRKAITPAVVTLAFWSKRRRDPDGMAKLPLDALVKAGLLVDDGPPHVAELRLRSERGEARTTVKIEAAGERG